MTELSELEQRLSRLERENRRWRTGILLALAIGATVLLARQVNPAPGVLEGQALVLKDYDGRVRVRLGPLINWVPKYTIYGLWFRDADGFERGSLHFEERLETLDLNARSTPSSALLRVMDGEAKLDLTATLQTRAAREREDAEFKKKLDGKTSKEQFELWSKRRVDEVTTYASAYAPGTSSLGLWHGLGGRIELQLLEGQSSLHLEDERNKTRAVIGHTSLEQAATGVVEERPVSSIVLFGKDGKVTWKAP